MADNDSIVGETPFTAEERYHLRRMMRAMRDITPDDMQDMKKFAQSGRVVRALGSALAKFILFLSGAVGAFTFLKGYFGKGP